MSDEEERPSLFVMINPIHQVEVEDNKTCLLYSREDREAIYQDFAGDWNFYDGNLDNIGKGIVMLTVIL